MGKKSKGEDLAPSQRKVPFELAAAELAELDRQVEETGGDLSSALIELFQQARMDVAEGIDRRRGYADVLRATIAAAEAQKSRIEKIIDKRKRQLDLLLDNTKQVMEAHPNLPFVDSLGERVLLCKNGQPSLRHDLDVREKVNVANVIDLVSVTKFDVSPKYLHTVSHLCLNTETLRQDLKAGEVIPWARLEWGNHIRNF